MKTMFLLSGALVLCAAFSQATTLTVASPNDNNYTGHNLSPRFGVYINFDDLTPFGQVAPTAYAAMGVQSITSNTSSNPLFAYPFSSQTAPNYLSTASSVTGGITITLDTPVNIIGIGVVEADGASDTLEALGATGNVLGTYTVTVPIDGNTPFNAYYVIQDTSLDIKSLMISSSTGNFGIDDLQFAPEPFNLTLVGGGLLILGLARMRKMKANLEA